MSIPSGILKLPTLPFRQTGKNDRHAEAVRLCEFHRSADTVAIEIKPYT